MLNNLKAEMARADITTGEVAAAIGKSRRTVIDRIKGKAQFPIQDAITVKDVFFPGMDLEYLFDSAEQQDSA